MSYPLFISNPDYCRRIFLPYKKKIDKKVKSILEVKAERKGGFTNKSYQVRYEVLIERLDDEKTKMNFWGLSSPDPTRFQSWRVMDYLWERDFSSKNYSISQPIAYIKKHSMVITREVKGRSLFKIFEKKSFPEIYLGLKNSANWLKKLHSISPYSFKDVFSSYSKKYWQEQFRILKEGYPKKSQILMKIIKEILNWEKDNEKSLNRVITHYDFQPKNIILKDGKTIIIDFSESRLSKAIVDVLTFLIQIELMNENLKFSFSLNEIKKFSKIFLKEYFSSNFPQILKDPVFRRDFNIIRRKIAAQTLVGTIILKKKSKIFSNILFGKSENLIF
jgi:thiamine kinase-like enzyme